MSLPTLQAWEPLVSRWQCCSSGTGLRVTGCQPAPPPRPSPQASSQTQPLRVEHLQGGGLAAAITGLRLPGRSRDSAQFTLPAEGGPSSVKFSSSFCLFSCLAHFRLISLNERNDVRRGVEEGHGSHVAAPVTRRLDVGAIVSSGLRGSVSWA